MSVHVDEFIDNYEGDKYAGFFFLLHRLPAILQNKYGDYIAKYRLFCDYEGVRYRVTGASRMGDVWLSKDFKRDTGYDHRVDLDKCSKWSENP